MGGWKDGLGGCMNKGNSVTQTLIRVQSFSLRIIISLFFSFNFNSLAFKIVYVTTNTILPSQITEKNMHLKTCFIYSVHLKSVFKKCGLYVSFQKYRELFHRHRELAAYIIWIKSQSPWRTMPSAQYSHLPLTSFLPLSLLLLSTSSELPTAHSSRPLHLEGSAPQISTSLLPLHKTSGYHSNYCPHSEANPSHSIYKCALPQPQAPHLSPVTLSLLKIITTIVTKQFKN